MGAASSLRRTPNVQKHPFRSRMEITRLPVVCWKARPQCGAQRRPQPTCIVPVPHFILVFEYLGASMVQFGERRS
jgi:hypothetical protein